MTSRASRTRWARAAWIPLVSALACAPETPPADLVFVGGPVYTLDESLPWAEAVAVRGPEIVFVGSRAGVRPLVDDTTRLVDLDGRLLLPRLGDGELRAICAAATGREPEAPSKTQTIQSVEDAIASRVSGKLVPGSAADLTVLQENILRILPERIAETKIEMTVIRGAVVYVAATFDRDWSTTLE